MAHAKPDISLEGWWFHSTTSEGALKWQGQILAEKNLGEYEVQLYEWGFGEPTDRLVVSLSDMRQWRFYPFNAWMREAHALSLVSPAILRQKRCPRCVAVGDVYAAQKDDTFVIIWRKNGEFSSLDTGVTARGIQDPTFGCGYDKASAVTSDDDGRDDEDDDDDE